MKAIIYDEKSLRAVSPAALSAYVRSEGWTKTGTYGEHSDIYHRDGAGELIIPVSQEIDDYPDVLSRVIGKMSLVEERGELQIYNDLTVSDVDVVRVSARHAGEDGSIDIESGVGLISRSRDLLLSAACSAWQPKTSYRAGKVKEATNYMEGVRLGQTERGSYIVSLLAPVPLKLASSDQAELWPDLLDEPFERTVTRMLAQALSEAKRAAESAVRGGGIEPFENAVPKGVSANLCEALAGILDTSGDAEFSITWAKTRPAPSKRYSLRLTRDSAPIFREAARSFRSSEPKIDESFEAFVLKLHRDEGDQHGRVTLRSVVDGHLLSVQTELSEKLYAVAVTAHKNRVPVLINGDLTKRGQRWWLSEPRSFVVQDVEEIID